MIRPEARNMNIGQYSVENPVISWLLVVILVGGGLIGFSGMGKLEDPAFTIKSAKILTAYPGATALEVQNELTYHLEDAIQKMPQIKRINMSVSRPGLSDILIDFKDEYKAQDLPNIFDELRRKIADVTPRLPPGAQPPVVLDDFGDVYGVYLILTGDGYTWRDLYDTADAIKKQLILVPGVRKVVIDGVQGEVVYLDISRSRMAELGIDLAPHASTAIADVAREAVSLVVTLCAEEVCPVFPADVETHHWPFSDPAAVEGDDETKLAAFREVRDQIRSKLEVWFDRQLSPPD